MCKITEELKKAVWEKADIVEGYSPKIYRKDPCGAWIIFNQYGDRKSFFGWEIDHIYPQSVLREKKVLEEEIDNIDNLRPMNWMNNDSKGTDYPVYHAVVTSEGAKNVKGDFEYEVADSEQEKINTLFGKYL